MLGYQRLFVRRWEWLMLIPTDGRLPQTSQTAAIELGRIAARSGRPGVGGDGTGLAGPKRERAASRVAGVTPVQLVFIGDGTSRKSLGMPTFARVVRTYRDALADPSGHPQPAQRVPGARRDTGTNMALTVDAVKRELAAAEADGREPDLDSVATSLSHGSLMGARGNSGVIFRRCSGAWPALFVTPAAEMARVLRSVPPI